MSETHTVAPAELEESNKAEMPIDIIGDKIKSGQKVLADYDPATGAVEVRPKWRDLTDAIMAVVDEVEEGKDAEKFRGEGVPVDEDALEKANEIASNLTEELEEKMQEAAPPGFDLSALSPDMAAVIMMMQQQNAALMAKLDKDDDAKLRSRDMGVIEEGRVGARDYAEALADDIEFSKANEGVPYPPKKNPASGDKTPSYVNWLKQYRPELYATKFDVTDHDRQITLRTRDGKPMQITADVARRKVHTTHKPDKDPSLAPDQDWNA